MGKSYENFMCKKFFHPTAKHNIKKVWMREQELEQEGKEENEAIEQYKRKKFKYSPSDAPHFKLNCVLNVVIPLRLFSELDKGARSI